MGGFSLAFGGCAFLPSAGPSYNKIQKDAAAPAKPGKYELVQIDGRVTETLAGRASVNYRATGDLQAFGAPAKQAITEGDLVNVTIYEAGGALFGVAKEGETGGGANQIPSQIVDQSGEITVPYAGRIQALGKTPHEIELDIADKLKAKVIDPQVVVTVTERNGGNFATIGGDVKASAQLPVTLVGTRVLDAISASGGSTAAPIDTIVNLTRGSRTRSDSLAAIMANPSKNVVLQPGDTVILRNKPRSYLAFGATGKTSAYPFPTENLSLAEAVAGSGGPLDNRANPGTIFLYRHESTKLVRRMGYGADDWHESTIPVIYQLDLHAPEGFFYAQSFMLRDKDIVYYPNAQSVGVMKFLELLNALTAPARSGLATATGLDAVGN